jgi:hypothetical protein
MAGMARKDRLIEEVKLGGVWGAVSLGMFVAATGGTAGLALSLYPGSGAMGSSSAFAQ